jgi:hypothetical protein
MKVRLQDLYSPDDCFSSSPDDGKKKLMLAKVDIQEKRFLK